MATPEEMVKDEVRMHQVERGCLCEHCYQEYLDRLACGN